MGVHVGIWKYMEVYGGALDGAFKVRTAAVVGLWAAPGAPAGAAAQRINAFRGLPPERYENRALLRALVGRWSPLGHLPRPFETHYLNYF